MSLKNWISIFKESSNSFEGQEKDEKVLFLLRRHPFYLLTELAVLILLALLPVLAALFFFRFIYKYDMVTFFLASTSILYLILWQIGFHILTMYTLDVLIVTNKRVIDTTQNGFFDRTISELHLARIQDMSVRTEGLIQTFLKFGDLEIQTAGSQHKFKMHQIPNPETVKDRIMSIIPSHRLL